MHSPQMVIQCFRIALQLPANSGFTITIVKHSSDKIFLSSQLVMRVFIPLFFDQVVFLQLFCKQGPPWFAD